MSEASGGLRPPIPAGDGFDAHSYAEALRETTLRFERLVQALSILRQMDELDDPECDMDEICRRMLETITFGLEAENCSLMLLDDDGEFLELRAACSPLENQGKSFGPGVWPGPKFRLGEGTVGRAAETGHAIRVDDVTLDEDFVPLGDSPIEVRSLLCFPLRVGGKTTGVLNLSHSEANFFSIESENTLTLVAERAARIFTSHLLRERLRQSEAHYRLVAENADDGILVFDRDGRVVSANPAVAHITGMPAEDIMRGEADWEYGIHPDDRQRFMAHRTKLFSNQIPSTMEYRYLDVHGEVHYLEQRSSPLLDSSGQVVGIVCIARDVTERKRVEEELSKYRDHLEELVEDRSAELIKANQELEREMAERKANEEERRKLEAQIRHAQKLESLGIMAAGIAHDFNNLLTGILGNAERAQDELSPLSPARARLERIEAAVRRAADLCRQMLAYSGKGQFITEPLNLNEVIEGMVRLLEISISKKIVLKYNFAQNLPSVEADATQVRQIVMNLVSNASEAIGEKTGVITVDTGVVECDRAYLGRVYLDEGLPEGTYVCLGVSDTGCGMDEETLSKVFEPFFTTKFTGRGLGLAAVLGIVRGHKGAVDVQSERGRGTTFKVLLPATGQPAEAAKEAPASASQSRVGRNHPYC